MQASSKESGRSMAPLTAYVLAILMVFTVIQGLVPQTQAIAPGAATIQVDAGPIFPITNGNPPNIPAHVFAGAKSGVSYQRVFRVANTGAAALTVIQFMVPVLDDSAYPAGTPCPDDALHICMPKTLLFDAHNSHATGWTVTADNAASTSASTPPFRTLTFTAIPGYSTGSTVAYYDTDLGTPPSLAVKLLRVGSAGPMASDTIYGDVDCPGAGCGSVTAGDFRYTAFGTGASCPANCPAGTTVAAGDADVAHSVTSVIPLIRVGSAAAAGTDAIYGDLDNSGTVTPGDYRYTKLPGAMLKVGALNTPMPQQFTVAFQVQGTPNGDSTPPAQEFHLQVRGLPASDNNPAHFETTCNSYYCLWPAGQNPPSQFTGPGCTTGQCPSIIIGIDDTKPTIPDPDLSVCNASVFHNPPPAPALTCTIVTRDYDHNGHIDRIVVTFDDEMDPSTLDISQFKIFNKAFPGIPSGHPYLNYKIMDAFWDEPGFNTGPDWMAGNYRLTFLLQEQPYYDTGATPNLQYTAGTLADKAGNLMASISGSSKRALDGSNPILIEATAVRGDNHLHITFSEQVVGNGGDPTVGLPDGRLDLTDLFYIDDGHTTQQGNYIQGPQGLLQPECLNPPPPAAPPVPRGCRPDSQFQSVDLDTNNFLTSCTDPTGNSWTCGDRWVLTTSPNQQNASAPFRMGAADIDPLTGDRIAGSLCWNPGAACRGGVSCPPPLTIATPAEALPPPYYTPTPCNPLDPTLFDALIADASGLRLWHVMPAVPPATVSPSWCPTPPAPSLSCLPGSITPAEKTSAVWDNQPPFPATDKRAYIFGGDNGVAPLSQIYMFTPNTAVSSPTGVSLPPTVNPATPGPRTATSAVWVPTSPAFNPTWCPYAATKPGCAFIFGGSDMAGNYIGDIVNFQPGPNTVTTIPENLLYQGTPQGREGTSAVWDPYSPGAPGPGVKCSQGCAYIFGGHTEVAGNTPPDVYINDIVRYDPGNVAPAARLQTLPEVLDPPAAGGLGLLGREGTSAVWAPATDPNGCPAGSNGCAYIFGGFGFDQNPPPLTPPLKLVNFKDIYRFTPDVTNPNGGTSVKLPETMPEKVSWTSAVWSGCSAYIIGGKNDAPEGMTTVVQFTPTAPTNRLRVFTSIPNPGRDGTSSVFDDQHRVVFTFGGHDDTNTVDDLINGLAIGPNPAPCSNPVPAPAVIPNSVAIRYPLAESAMVDVSHSTVTLKFNTPVRGVPPIGTTARGDIAFLRSDADVVTAAPGDCAPPPNPPGLQCQGPQGFQLDPATNTDPFLLPNFDTAILQLDQPVRPTDVDNTPSYVKIHCNRIWASGVSNTYSAAFIPCNDPDRFGKFDVDVSPDMAFADVTLPTVIAAHTVDGNHDGFVDGVQLTFSEPVNDATFCFNQIYTPDFCADVHATGLASFHDPNMVEPSQEEGRVRSVTAARQGFRWDTGALANDQVGTINLVTTTTNATTGLPVTRVTDFSTYTAAYAGTYLDNRLLKTDYLLHLTLHDHMFTDLSNTPANPAMGVVGGANIMPLHCQLDQVGNVGIAPPDPYLHQCNPYPILPDKYFYRIAVTDGAPPVVMSAKTVDTPWFTVEGNTVSKAQAALRMFGNGTIDGYRVTFSEPVSDGSFCAREWHVEGFDPITGARAVFGMRTADVGDNNPDHVNDNEITILFNETKRPDTGERPDLTYTQATPAVKKCGGGMRDLHSNVMAQLSTFDLPEGDGAAPGIWAVEGFVGDNKLTIHFTEPVDDGARGSLVRDDFKYSNINGNGVAGESSTEPVCHGGTGPTGVYVSPPALCTNTTLDSAVIPLSSALTADDILKDRIEARPLKVFEVAPSVPASLRQAVPNFAHKLLEAKDITPPGMITDLRAINANTNANTVVLAWTAPGNNGFKGTVCGYTVKANTTLGVAAHFANITNPTGLTFTYLPPPNQWAPANQTQTVKIIGLQPETTYHFAVTAQDCDRNVSPPSNEVAETTTRDTTPPIPVDRAGNDLVPPVLRVWADAPCNQPGGTVPSNSTCTFHWSATRDPESTPQYRFNLTGDPAYQVLSTDDSTAQNSTSVAIPGAGDWYFHVAAFSAGGATATASYHVVGGSLTPQQIQAANDGLNSNVTAERQGGNKPTPAPALPVVLLALMAMAVVLRRRRA
jgi:hypothetical protein